VTLDVTLPSPAAPHRQRLAPGRRDTRASAVLGAKVGERGSAKPPLALRSHGFAGRRSLSVLLPTINATSAVARDH